MRKMIVTLMLAAPLLCNELPAQAKKSKPAGTATVAISATLPAPTPAPVPAKSAPAVTATTHVAVAAAPPPPPPPPFGASVSVQGSVVQPAQVTVQAGPPAQTVTVQAVPLYPVVQVTADGYAAQPAPPPPAPTCAWTTDADLSSLVSAISAESFANSQLRVLGDASQGRCFLVAQVAEILPLFTFEDDRIKALQLLKSGITDRQNSFRIYGLFTFEAGKEQARRVLSR